MSIGPSTHHHADIADRQEAAREEWRAKQKAASRERVELERFESAVTSDGQRYVFAKLPRCPACSSPDLKSNRSEGLEDGTRRRWSRCQACGEKFILLLE